MGAGRDGLISPEHAQAERSLRKEVSTAEVTFFLTPACKGSCTFGKGGLQLISVVVSLCCHIRGHTEFEH